MLVSSHRCSLSRSATTGSIKPVHAANRDISHTAVRTAFTVDDGVWAAAFAQFGEAETVRLAVVIAAIKVWNRMNVTVRTVLPDRGATTA